jgi:predicted restriction endonuclease
MPTKRELLGKLPTTILEKLADDNDIHVYYNFLTGLTRGDLIRALTNSNKIRKDYLEELVNKNKKPKITKEKPKRKTISKSEWEAIKASHNYKCVICRKSEEAVGELQKAHIKAQSKGGSQVIPLCPTCHRKFDKGNLTDSELKKIGLTRAQYNKMIPK